MDNLFDYGDQLGPLKIIRVRERSLGLQAVLVIDNLACGPALGGVRMAPDVTADECARLARAMTLKNAAAGLPHGGAKMVIRADPAMPKAAKERLLRGLARALSNQTDYIFAPDMGLNEECMAWMRDEVDRVAGLPRELGGIPLDEIGATAWGLLHAAEVAVRHIGFGLGDARVVIQGFGAVGMNAARFFASGGAKVVAVADHSGALYHADGLPVAELADRQSRGQLLIDFPGAERLRGDQLFAIPCDIWIPAARPDVIHEGNVDQLDTRLVVQGANIPVTPGAEQRLHERGILSIPDFIANAGGVICAAMEYRGATESAVMDAIADKVTRNTEQVLQLASLNNTAPREAANLVALERLQRAMGYRRWSSFPSTGNLR